MWPVTDTLGSPLLRDIARAARAALDALHAPLPDVAVVEAYDADLPADTVQVRLSAHGRGSPLSGRAATPSTLFAQTGSLARCGIKGRAPVLPPDGVIVGCIATQLVFVMLLAALHRERTGEAVRLDASALDMLMGALDPVFGMMGSATDGRAASDIPRGRPSVGRMYPILPCADGFVRLCVLAPRQWRGMFRWLGEPDAFADPRFETIAARFKSAELWALIRAHFADRTRERIEAEAAAHGVPAASVRTLAEARAAPHVQQSRTVRFGEPVAGAAPLPPPGPRPLSGLRVLDMGVIVVGGDGGRLLADYGADVVKVENPAFADGARQAKGGASMSANFAAGHRNKRSLAVDLRDADGMAAFQQLLSRADVLLSNFKPGTLDGLGLDDASLAAINPSLVRVDSSAFGPVGPWARRLGYGPLVRAATGLTHAWRYPDDPDGFCDSATVYPDHAAARMSASAAMALLLRRARQGVGGRASISQAALLLDHLDLKIESPSGRVQPGEGDDAWDVVAGDAHAPMLRVPDLLASPHLAARDLLRPTAHPLLDIDPPNLARSVHAPWPDPDNRPAPTLGQHTDAVLAEWLS